MRTALALAAVSIAALSTFTGTALADGDDTGNDFDVISRTCRDSKLPEHDGKQAGNRCVETQMGEVSQASKNPSLLILTAPTAVKAGQPFTIKVSSRNLVRDRFLPAGKGGYYLERSVLTKDGIQRGHFHTACRMVDPTTSAPSADVVPDAFVATEDGSGGLGADTVEVRIPGLPNVGIAQCATWAGDGSHRIPMMERANEIPAFDTVRISVK